MKIKRLFSSIVRRPRHPALPETETTRDGVGVSPGIVIGQAYVYDTTLENVPRYHLKDEQISPEIRRFTDTVGQTVNEINAVTDRAKNVLESDPLTSLLDVYRHILKGSRLMRGVVRRIEKDRINAEAAVLDEIAALSDVFSAMEDPYISARIEDIRNIGQRLLRNLQTNISDNLDQLPDNAIVIAQNLSATDTAMLSMRKIAALITVNGSAQSHTALLARSLGIPSVVGVADIMKIASTGDLIALDGTYGKIIVHPTPETIELYRKYRTDFLRWKRSLKRLRDQPSATTDGVYIRLKGNIDLPEEVPFLLQTGGDGIGLMRSEYLYMNRDTLPAVDDITAILNKIVDQMPDKPIIFRTVDIGADKCLPDFSNYKAPNPALGLRGIRFAHQNETVLADQFEAVLQVCSRADIRILLPMVSSVTEILNTKALLNKVADKLRAEGKPVPDKLPPVGAMIEVPSAALEADLLAANCDFLSIGTNDLIQYTVAVDRTDVMVTKLFNPLNPAVLKLIKMTIDAANAHNIPVSVCGEIAANYHYAALLIGLGVRELSMPAVNIPMVKERIRSISLYDAERFANHILTLHYPDDITSAFNAFEEGKRF